MIKKYVKKPIVVEAIQWTGYNIAEVKNFAEGHIGTYSNSSRIAVSTPEGRLFAYSGYYIIKGINGEFYPCKPDVFKKTYEEIK